MIIFKPDWVFHGDRSQEGSKIKKQCIYSIDVHPDGKRLATGSLDTTVKIWNTDPIYDENAEKNPKCHKLLCTMTLHSGAVLCVRWSKDGRYLASSSDNDNVIIIWELDSEAGSGSVFGSSEVNHETWRAVKYLRGHDSDVQDLAWSNNNQYLASCGVDGFIIIWDARTFEQIHKIDQHSGFVNGITWDPVGKYLASQSDDKKVKIWRTSDWQEEAEIEDPFYNAPGTTFFRRLSWSPEGSHIAASNAVNANQCVAAIISRDNWDSDVSLVGHDVPIEVASFNPKLFYGIQLDEEEDEGETDDEDTKMEVDSNDRDGKDTLASVCALGGQDRGLSIWVTRRTRPLCVARNVFENNIYDLAWTPDGQTLFACSQDGTIACLQLKEELAEPASDDEVLKKLTQYGYGRKNTQLPETPSQLDLEAENKPNASQSTTTALATTTTPSTSNRIANIMNGGMNGTAIDLDTRSENAKNNKNEMTDATVIQKKNDDKFTSSSSGVATITEQKVTITKSGKRRIQPIALSRNTGLSTTTPSTPSTQRQIISHISQPPLESVDYDLPVMNLGKNGIGSTVVGNKRKAHPDNVDNNQTTNGITMQQTTKDNEPLRQKPAWIDAAIIPPIVSQSQVKLGLPKVKSTMINRISQDNQVTVMECHNPTGKQGSENTKLLTSRHGTILWTDYLASAILLMTGNEHFSAVGCEDASILVYSPAGRRLLPPIVLESTPVVITCNDCWLLCLTATGLLYTWDIVQQKSQFTSVSISPLLRVAQTLASEEPHVAPSLKDIRIQKNGLPLIITSYHQAFTYHTGMNTWLRISDAWFIISEFWGSGSSSVENHPLGWLSTALTMTGTADPTNESLMALAKLDSDAASTITISHIENQLAAALILESAKEYKEWMIYYARRLSKENAQKKVEELCQWLMGPPFVQSTNGEWESTILKSIPKHDLLKELLPVLAQNRQLQRITTEFRSLL
ncbi:WD40-repeat-containing domain protein [Halteromyces radiatus]|uniref:WD40-repeat-containing domain protein n=1 Tax=Halteromyces radiatus TaxID=101107 RepID=UPI0022209B94|nr:WD40-repeat-containing domain protein [Halteromyces radiatus]KAI8093179.1 WD40-repeat-containing domain protein [Halteromyces radiatus]